MDVGGGEVDVGGGEVDVGGGEVDVEELGRAWTFEET